MNVGTHCTYMNVCLAIARFLRLFLKIGLLHCIIVGQTQLIGTQKAYNLYQPAQYCASLLQITESENVLLRILLCCQIFLVFLPTRCLKSQDYLPDLSFNKQFL